MREYNGNKLSLSIFPNRAKTARERTLLLQELKIEFAKALEDNWNPFTGQKVVPQKEMSLEQLIVSKLNTIATGNYSRTYQSAIKSLGNKILIFLTKYEKKATLEQLETERLLIFLDKFNSSNRNYKPYSVDEFYQPSNFYNLMQDYLELMEILINVPNGRSKATVRS